MSVATEKITTKIPARMDRLPWSRWHWLVILSLGTVWVLDGLEVTIKGAVGAQLKESIGFSTVQVAGVASIYLFGAISGALFWAYLTDRFGRKKLFIITLAVYMVGVLGTTFAGVIVPDGTATYVWFAVFRFITGFGIGGEYAAINSAIDELIPARVRGWADIAINGSWWLGTAVGAALGALYLNIFPSDVGWRVAFGMGGFLAFGILLLRMFVPESPRWLITHGQEEEAERTVREIEEDVKDKTGVEELPEVSDDDELELRERESIGFVDLGRNLFKLYPRRSVVGFSILTTQAFLYNAIFFTYGLMLTTFFGVSAANVGLFLIPFAVGNYAGPLILGRWFDTAGRRVMIPLTFGVAGVLTIVVGLLFATQVITSAWLMTLCWVVIFFFASAGASSGYLTVSETFPLEIRAMAIAFFYALGTAAGGVLAPFLFGNLIEGTRWTVFIGYAIGGVLMLAGGAIHRLWGVEAAQEDLESIAKPLSVEEAEGEDTGGVGLEGPAGVDPSDAESVKRFQRAHDLEPDGVVGPTTAGALRAELGADPDRANGELVLVDVTDPGSIRAFQRDHGLRADGVLGPVTRGALRAAEHRTLVDPNDPDSVKRFQVEHMLEADGRVGPRTRAALAAARAERTGSSEPFVRLDVLDPESVERFQRACGLPPDGVIGPETRGALLAERARQAREENDALDGEAIADLSARVRGFGVDPADVRSIERFQRAAGLDPDGDIGPLTRAALRRAPHLVLDVDPSDSDSIRVFQREHGLREDGVIGHETRGALRHETQEAARRGRGEEDDLEQAPADLELDGLLAFDPSDGAAVVKFQDDHGLEPDGVIGPRTQAALVSALAESESAMTHRTLRRRRRFQRPLATTSGHASASYLPPEDRELDDQLGELVDVLERRGSASSRELRDEVRAGLWGPGRFRYVVRTAEREGVLRRVGRDRYALGR
jgi:murein L,D-transpeptidase YcbB/YkuD/MFS family permease